MLGFIGSDRARWPGQILRRRAPLCLAAIALAGAVIGCSGSGSTPTIGNATPTPGAPTPSPTSTLAPTPTPTPTPTPISTPGPCNASDLTITIQDSGGGIFWQGGGGHALATFQLQNTGSVACTVKARTQPMLLNGDGSILILGLAAGASATLTLAPSGTLKAIVQTGNLCNSPTIVAPVKVGFMEPGSTGLVVAQPLSPSDVGGVPPCLGDPSITSGSIEMQPWSP
jgi:hypothetical protein